MQCPRQEGNLHIHVYLRKPLPVTDSNVHGGNRVQHAQPEHGAYSESRLVYAVAKKKTTLVVIS